MKKTFILLVVLSFQVQAQIESGTWKGNISDEAVCFLDVGAQTYENDIINPLNERIAINIGSTTYSVKHPYSIDPLNGLITFNNDLYEDVVATSTGAFALQIKMKDSKPAELTVMEDDWASGFREVIHCDQLVKVY